MLGIFYIGLPRFQEQTRDNHAWVMRELEQRFGNISLTRFLQPEFDRTDMPVSGSPGSAGGIQVWDFMKAAQLIDCPVIMKWRTDNWFAKSSIDPLLHLTERVLTEQIDVGYLGSNVKNGLRIETHATLRHAKVPDFVIVSRRAALRPIDQVRSSLLGSDVKNGNLVFRCIAQNLERCETAWCRIFLVRQERDVMTDYTVASDFVRGYKAGQLSRQFLDGCDPEQPL